MARGSLLFRVSAETLTQDGAVLDLLHKSCITGLSEPHWQDGDCSWVRSPLESAATLGHCQNLSPVQAGHGAGILARKIQHWGTNFHCLLGDKVALPTDQPAATEGEAVGEPQCMLTKIAEMIGERLSLRSWP